MKTYITLLLCCCFTLISFSQSITDIEYFYNTDPGFGNATPITANANTGNLTQTLSLPVPIGLSDFNTLYIRGKDNNGVWSLYDSRVFFITQPITGGATNIVAAEYFINTDPDFGNADAIAINANTGNVTQTLSLPISNTLTGFNTLYIRTQDDLGVWSLYDSRVFFISEPITGGATDIVAAEYFINIDPGFGNANAIAINANTGNITQTLSLPISNTLTGFNILYIRTQDNLGVWSLYDSRTFYIYEDQIISPIVAAEYFYDVDPGFGNGTAATITPTGNPDEFTIDLATTDITCDFHDFYIRLQNQDGSWSLYDYGLQIEVFDNADPTIVVFPNITAELDANGQASITIADVDNGTFDDCELVSVVLNQTQFDYTCANLGANTVTVTATDAEAKVSTLDVTITVVDLINPVAISQNITVQLDASGNVNIVADDVDNSSTDNCSITTKAIDFTSFNCTNLGDNTVTLTVEDQSGNTNSTTATVTVEDNINPTVVTQNITVQLDANGTASITVNDIENGSTDNCTIASSSLDVTSFTCNDLGSNTVTLSVTDQSNNTGTNTATVTVQDNINPVAITQNITVQLDASGNISIVADDVDNSSTDNCTITTKSLDLTSFNCTNLGDNTVSLTVTDQSGNTNSTTATVTVEDPVSPTVIGQDISIDIAGNPSVIITANDVDNGSFDNCNFSLSVDVDTFTSIGIFDVILTGIDNFGNISSVSVLITVTDSTFGVEENELLSKQIILFPVPTKGSLNISTNLIIDVINIFDINGRKILQIDNPNRVIDVSNLSSGVYFLRFNVENTLVTKRIIRQ